MLKYVREGIMGGRRVSSMHLITLGHQHRFELFDTLMKAESLRVTEQKLGLTLSVQEAEVWDLSSSQDASGKYPCMPVFEFEHSRIEAAVQVFFLLG